MYYFNNYCKPKSDLIKCSLSPILKAAQNRYKDQNNLKSRQEHVNETALKACEKTKSCLKLNIDTHLYYETRFLLIL